MHLETGLPCRINRGLGLRNPLYRPACEIVRVLEHDEGHIGLVVRPGRDRVGHVLGSQVPVRGLHAPRHDAGERAHRRKLVADDVAPPFDEDLIALFRQDADRDSVTHRAGRHEQGRLEAQELRDSRLETPHGLVLPEDVVSHLGLGHCTAHLGRGLGDGVGAQIDGLHSRRTLLPRPHECQKGRGVPLRRGRPVGLAPPPCVFRPTCRRPSTGTRTARHPAARAGAAPGPAGPSGTGRRRGPRPGTPRSLRRVLALAAS